MKLKTIFNEILSESLYKFDSYQDLLDYVKDKVKEQGQKYYTTQEYKDIYPIGQKLYKVEKNKYIDKKSKEMSDNDVKEGDKVQITWTTMFGGSNSIIGTIFMKNGVPYVKLPHKMPVSVKGRISYKSSIPYSSKNMRKIE